MALIQYLIAHFGELVVAFWAAVGALASLLSALLALALLTPGDQPDKALRAALDFLLRFSRKAPPQE